MRCTKCGMRKSVKRRTEFYQATHKCNPKGRKEGDGQGPWPFEIRPHNLSREKIKTALIAAYEFEPELFEPEVLPAAPAPPEDEPVVPAPPEVMPAPPEAEPGPSTPPEDRPDEDPSGLGHPIDLEEDAPEYTGPGGIPDCRGRVSVCLLDPSPVLQDEKFVIVPVMHVGTGRSGTLVGPYEHCTPASILRDCPEFIPLPSQQPDDLDWITQAPYKRPLAFYCHHFAAQ